MKWNKSKDVFALMVGHGRSLDGTWDCGTAYKGYNEAALMLKIVKAAVKLLRKSGVKVITDADDANNRNMKASVAWANSKKARLYMSVHCDWSPAPTGVYPQIKTAADKKFGESVGKRVAKLMGMKYRGTCKRPATGLKSLYELNQPTAEACCVFETGAIKADLENLKNYKKYGRALAKAICKYIGVPVYVSTATKIRRKTAELLAYAVKHKFKYEKSYKKCATNWKGAKKLKRMNCHLLINYVCQELGLLKENMIFWFNNTKIVCRGKGTRAMILKNFKILRPNKIPKNAGLKKGDFTASKDKAHTHEYAGWRKTYPLFYSWGPSDAGKKQPRHKKSYDTRKITIIMRAK